MQPDTKWDAERFQFGLAATVGNPESAVPEGLDGRGVSVYRRLVHNNIASFLNRCFSESIGFADEATWQNLCNRFLSEGKPESPYFKDIPEQFLQFILSLSDRPLPLNVLAMMEFEADLLHAETTLRENVARQDINDDSLLTWAQGGRLKPYSVDFVSSHLARFEVGQPNVLTWRNADDETCYQAIGEIDVLLLQHFQEQNDSIGNLLAFLSELTGNRDAEPLLRARIAHWLGENVLVPV
ncbi:putative DNA-binding domain-containing protein [Neisseria iguanae]|uniref:DUF2063 domain-containing protein n=1 Tax=Neisseria iguanae TaxID=90242 RepID=A0A2P7U272_9NEIS|nr:putative DNA-binding domain-containing protein [Neisseria iguanae]PSJ81066.1 DUF2063 domain-containing protein [Neisseria iguanae]